MLHFVQIIRCCLVHIVVDPVGVEQIGMCLPGHQHVLVGIDPSSVLRAAVMLLEHIGEIELAKKLDRALDICMVEERKVVVTGRDTGATAQEFTDYVLDTIAKL